MRIERHIKTLSRKQKEEIIESPETLALTCDYPVETHHCKSSSKRRKRMSIGKILLIALISVLCLSVSTAMPAPEYLSVPNWKACTATESAGSARFVCLPVGKTSSLFTWVMSRLVKEKTAFDIVNEDMGSSLNVTNAFYKWIWHIETWPLIPYNSSCSQDNLIDGWRLLIFHNTF